MLALVCLSLHASLFLTYTTAQRSLHVRKRPYLRSGYQLEPLLLTSARLGNIQREEQMT